MKIIPIKTRIIKPPQDDIYQALDEFCPTLLEQDVFLVTSKILAIHQGRCLPITSIRNKDDLIKQEADVFIPREECPGEHVILTVKNNTLIPSAGVDESNGNGYYILWPQDPAQEAKKICQYLKKRFFLKKLAVIITDSHTMPMRYGVLGISIGFYGLNPLKDYRGRLDIFKRTMQMSQSNIVDALAVMGVLAMGEGNEQRPLAIIRGADFVEFTNQETYKASLIPTKEDIFYPLLKKFYNQGNLN